MPDCFKFYFHNLHCRHVFFGGPADGSYARPLNPYSRNEIAKRITLLKGRPFVRDMADLAERIRHTSFDDVFRNTEIPSHGVSVYKKAPSPSLGQGWLEPTSPRPKSAEPDLIVPKLAGIDPTMLKSAGLESTVLKLPEPSSPQLRSVRPRSAESMVTLQKLPGSKSPYPNFIGAIQTKRTSALVTSILGPVPRVVLPPLRSPA